MKKAFTLTFLLMLMPVLGLSQYGNTAAYRFLNVPVSPQSAALGGGPASLTEGNPAQMHINPAFLHGTMHGNVSATWSRLLAEVDMGFVSGVWHSERIGTFGAGIRYMNYGEFDRIDAAGVNDGTFRASDMAVKLAMSRTYAGIIRYGVGVDFIYSAYESFTSTAIGFSGGLIVDLSDIDTSVGLSVRNLGTQLSTYDGVTEDLPIDIRLSVSRKLQHLPLRLSLTAHSLDRWDMSTPNDTEDPGFATNFFRHLAIGGEFLFSENVHLRLGYNQLMHDELKTDRRIDLAGFGIGVMIRVKSVGLEVSRNSYSEMGHLLQLGIQTRF